VGLRRLADDDRGRSVDDDENHHGNDHVHGQIQTVCEPPVLEKPEQIHIPLVEIGQAIDEDHEQRELVDVVKERAAGLIVEIFQQADQNEIPQQVEKPRCRNCPPSRRQPLLLEAARTGG
jgi:hypothetical protein